MRGAFPLITGAITCAAFLGLAAMLLSSHRWEWGAVAGALGLFRTAWLVVQWRQWRAGRP